MSAELVTTQHVHRKNAAVIADELASIAGFSLSLRPLVQFADRPIELELLPNGTAWISATLTIELDADQVAMIKRLAEQGDEYEGEGTSDR